MNLLMDLRLERIELVTGCIGCARSGGGWGHRACWKSWSSTFAACGWAGVKSLVLHLMGALQVALRRFHLVPWLVRFWKNSRSILSFAARKMAGLRLKKHLRCGNLKVCHRFGSLTKSYCFLSPCCYCLTAFASEPYLRALVFAKPSTRRAEAEGSHHLLSWRRASLMNAIHSLYCC